jgi:hypothetical protein
MVAEQEKRFFFYLLGHVIVFLPWKGMAILVGPDPLDFLFLILEVRDIVGSVTGLYGLMGGLLIKLLYIHHQGPSLSYQGIWGPSVNRLLTFANHGQ